MSLSFASGVDLEEGKAAVAAIHGVLRVRQVFPDETDDELRRMFVLDLDAEAKDTALAALKRSNLVEEAELVPQRGIGPRSDNASRG